MTHALPSLFPCHLMFPAPVRAADAGHVAAAIILLSPDLAARALLRATGAVQGLLIRHDTEATRGILC